MQTCDYHWCVLSVLAMLPSRKVPSLRLFRRSVLARGGVEIIPCVSLVFCGREFSCLSVRSRDVRCSLSEYYLCSKETALLGRSVCDCAVIIYTLTDILLTAPLAWLPPLSGSALWRVQDIRRILISRIGRLKPSGGYQP